MSRKIITLGEVMMRLTTPGNERFLQADQFNIVYGGAEANVSVSLAQWGLHAAHVTAFPKNDLGNAAARYLRQTGVDISHVSFNEGRMGLYFLENGAMQRSSKIIYDRFDSAFANFDGEAIDWDNIFEDADWFHWTGITPALSEKAAAMTLKALQVASSKGLMISGDINYRRNLWQYGKGPLDVMPELIQYTNVIVAGLVDFENCMDIKADDYEEACLKTRKNFPNIKYITTTERNSISASHNQLQGWLWNGRELLTSKTYDMTHIVDRVGGGDAYMAGLIYGLLFYSDQKALEFAVAASVLKHSISGDANLVSLEEVESLVKGEHVGKLLR
ncbi:2-dehydro-3-deoxygluconokinase [Rhodonellum psychrophilum GCM71 = DSM 17998]|uniref:2-dehydro-3-deoxygluconokinase n=2 Tax=Rhodonellum TaxID=336827 RepID=U5BQ74_9BACT|nr:MULTISPECIES: sugar kinase [Rhodonellum]ERM82720.1 2-dehydro-3-deoxygluconokinase [Rhodonellum psychrophilum GCM71 = DSM 17998]MDO9554441.1 sugar kinase [Rhodonellum sp.]SDZ29043.1 2-dehydro-3-deoxygluconokinase [Rhodonellum ikkaensis]